MTTSFLHLNIKDALGRRYRTHKILWALSAIIHCFAAVINHFHQAKPSPKDLKIAYRISLSFCATIFLSYKVF